MPKVVDYSGRFAFFELAAFTLVRDHGVSSLSRHGVARVLATSISTVRRLLHPEADLRSLALGEVRVRHRRRLRGRGPETGVDAALGRLAAVVPFSPADVEEELVWWRLAVSAPSTARPVRELEGDERVGPLHHQFAVASHGYVPIDVLQADVGRPTSGFVTDDDADVDVVVAARRERDEEVAARVHEAVLVAAPDLPVSEAERLAPVLHALVDGLGLAVALGRLTPAAAREVARAHLEGLACGRSLG
ncbi:TetR family transcriptional regulator C-terminal domain-containing protein [Nocardioides zeicaulis]|uniref:TetR family transcriptional regulator C-terminal domain-containing protein n=1 Tax=Nocardioides zeicaulis TaxID=1776857 RepID=A0ABV6E501_9ACTN